MTQEEKDLLLKDLCVRLPYGVMVHKVYDENTTEIIEMGPSSLHDAIFDDVEVKPYLRPISSMTEEECRELENIQEKYFGCALDKHIEECFSLSDKDESKILEYLASSKIVDYLNSKHFDYRGLIPRGLALEAPEGMYK